MNEELILALALLAGMAGFLVARVLGVTHQMGQMATVIVFMILVWGGVSVMAKWKKRRR